MHRFVIVFSGYNQRAVISFIRTLENNKMSRCAIFASSLHDTIFQTSYVDKVEYTRKNKQLNLQEICMAIDMLCQKYKLDECLIAPSTEALNRFLLWHRDILQKHNCIVPLVDKEIYESISDKYSFWKICKERNLCVPKRLTLPEQFTMPFVAKPKEYMTMGGKINAPIIVDSQVGLDDFKKNYSREDFFYEEYVTGESLYLLYYVMKSGKVYKFSQINYAQQAGGKSILAAECSTLHQEEIAQKYEALFLALKFWGFIMVEVRKGKADFYMIEANPRFWGPSQLFCDAGYNFFELFLWEYGFLDECPSFLIDDKATYLWSGGADFTSPGSFVWHDKGRERVVSDWERFEKGDIYRRKDTLGIFRGERIAMKKELLKSLYMKTSKHSNYQILPTLLRDIVDITDLEVKSRYEEERFNYILKNVNIEGKRVLDIGGNSGYFTFESYCAGASMVDYYEGNPAHAEFVEESKKVLGIQKNLNVHPEYFSFSGSDQKIYDIVFCLNVVHHLGDDFGEETNIAEAKKKMLLCINSMAKMTDILIFQMGYNWCGNVANGLFEGGTKQEMEAYLQDGVKDCWEIVKIGMAEKGDGKIQYMDKNERNSLREDSLGEFLNRPIFILKSKF